MAKRPSVSTQAACRSRPLTQRRRGKVQALLSITSLLLLCEVVVAPETSQTASSSSPSSNALSPNLDFREDGEFSWNNGLTSVVSGTYSIAAVRKITASNRTNELQWTTTFVSAIREIDVLRFATIGRVPFFSRYLAHAKDENNNPVLIVERAVGDILDNYYTNESLVAERKRLKEKAYENLFRAAIFVWHMEKLGLMHNDLQLRNLVVDPTQMLITVIDFNQALMTVNSAVERKRLPTSLDIISVMDIFITMRTGFKFISIENLRNQFDEDEWKFIKEFKYQNTKRCGPANLVRHPIFQQHGLVYEDYLSRMAPDTPPIKCESAASTLDQRP